VDDVFKLEYPDYSKADKIADASDVTVSYVNK